jgi:CubicO group peptidase (beta-lactamase class C family)
MEDTYFFLPEDKISRLTAIYEYDENGALIKLNKKVTGPGFLNPKINSNVFDPTYPYRGPRSCFFGGAGLSSTALDYMRFCQMILNKGILNGVRLLSPLTVDLMTRNHAGDYDIWLVGKGWHVGFGGVTLHDRDQNGYIMPNGTFNWGDYYSTNFEIDFKNDMIYMLFTQRSPYQNYQAGEFDKLRVLTHAAIVLE